MQTILMKGARKVESKVNLYELISATGKCMKKLGYSESTISEYKKIWKMLSVYANEKNIKEYTTELSSEYIESKFSDTGDFPGTDTQRRYRASLNKLDEYFHYGFITSKRLDRRKTYSFPKEFENQVFLYIKKRRESGLSESRIQSIMIYLERFTNHMRDIGLRSLKELRLPQVNSHIEYVTQFTASTITNTMSCLRGFFQYLYKTGDTAKDFSVYLPQLRHTVEDPIPSAFSKEEVEKVLNCVDRSNDKGKRDYAMLMLAAKLGLRSSDICGMEMSNLKWTENRIEIKQQKTGSQLILPLLNDVGNAIIDYLKVRPQAPLTDSPNVFLRVASPYVRLENKSLYTITEKYMQRSGIHIPPQKKHGPHSLRHSLSSILLEKRVPLPVISGILAHKSSDTTKVYLRIDILQLRECPLEVPSVSKREGGNNQYYDTGF